MNDLYSKYVESCKSIILTKKNIVNEIKKEISSDIEKLIEIEAGNTNSNILNEYFDNLYFRLENVETTANQVIQSKLIFETKKYISGYENLLITEIEESEFADFTDEIMKFALNKIQNEVQLEVGSIKQEKFIFKEKSMNGNLNFSPLSKKKDDIDDLLNEVDLEFEQAKK